MVKKIQCSFYSEELAKTSFKKDDSYIIEQVLKTNNNKAYVKFKGYSNNFNQWVNKSDIKKYL